MVFLSCEFAGSGWSEMDDWNDAPEAKPLAVDTKTKAPKTKKPSTSPTELFDVAKLRANVNKLEAEVFAIFFYLFFTRIFIVSSCS